MVAVIIITAQKKHIFAFIKISLQFFTSIIFIVSEDVFVQLAVQEIAPIQRNIQLPITISPSSSQFTSKQYNLMPFRCSRTPSPKMFQFLGHQQHGCPAGREWVPYPQNHVKLPLWPGQGYRRGHHLFHVQVSRQPQGPHPVRHLSLSRCAFFSRVLKLPKKDH